MKFEDHGYAHGCEMGIDKMLSISSGLDNKVTSVTQVALESNISDEVTGQQIGTAIADSYEPCASPLLGQTPNSSYVPEPKDVIKQDVAVGRSAEPVTWACLPKEVLSNILSHLPFTDLETVALVDKQCARAVKDDPKLDFETRQLWQRLVQLRTEGADVAVTAKRVTDFLKGKGKESKDPSVAENALIHRGLRLATIALNAVIDGAAGASVEVEDEGGNYRGPDFSLDTEENRVLNLAHDVIADHIGNYFRKNSDRYRGWQSFVRAYEIGREIGMNSYFYRVHLNFFNSATHEATSVVPQNSSASVIKILLCSVNEWSGEIDVSEVQSSVAKILSSYIGTVRDVMWSYNASAFFLDRDALDDEGESDIEKRKRSPYAPEYCSKEVNDIMAIKTLFPDVDIAETTGEFLESLDVISLHAALFSDFGEKLIAAYNKYEALFGSSYLAREFRVESYTYYRHKYYKSEFFIAAIGFLRAVGFSRKGRRTFLPTRNTELADLGGQ